MTIDERVEELYERLPATLMKRDASNNCNLIKSAMLKVARDQRHACAEASMAVFSEFPIVGDGQYANSGRINQAVMNAEIK